MKKLFSLFMVLVISLSVFAVSAVNSSAADDVVIPVFSATEESVSANSIKITFNLVSGSFNSLDLKFEPSQGLKCIAIDKSSTFDSSALAMTNVEATGEAYNASIVSTSGYTKAGAIFIATFQVTNTRLDSYSVTFKVGDCTVAKNVDNEIQNLSVSPISPVFTKKSLDITIDSLPKTTTYCVGQELNKDGLVVTAHYFNGTSKKVTNYETNYDFSSAGKKTVTVSYSENNFRAQATFDVTVAEHSLSDLVIKKHPTCTNSGLKEQSCTVCGKVCHSEVILATGHSFEIKVISRPTYKTTGENRKICTKCNHVEEIITVAKCDPDIDGNGSISSRDALIILQHATGLIQLTGSDLANADLDGSGDIKSNDALLVLQLATGLISR